MEIFFEIELSLCKPFDGFRYYLAGTLACSNDMCPFGYLIPLREPLAKTCICKLQPVLCHHLVNTKST